MVCLILALMFGMHVVVLFVHCKLLLQSLLVVPYYASKNLHDGVKWKTTEVKTDIAKFISFRVKFFRLRNFFVSINEIKIFPLTDTSVSVDANHTARKFSLPIKCLVNNSKTPQKCKIELQRNFYFPKSRNQNAARI